MRKQLVASAGYKLGSLIYGFTNSFQSARSKSWAELNRFFAQLSGSSDSKISTTSQLAEFQSWIYTILTTIYGRTSTVPWNLYVDRGGETPDLLENQTKHPLHKLLMRPNQFMTGSFLQQMTQINLDLTGMAFILKLRNRLGKPAELWPLNVGEFVDFISGGTTKDFITGYQFNTQSFERSEIIYLFYPNPDPNAFTSLASQQKALIFASLAGMSPIKAMARTIDIEKYIEIYEKTFFENSARPDVVISTDKKLHQNERQRLLEKFKQQHQGVNKFHEPTVIERGGTLDIKILSQTAKDFEFFNLAGWTKDMLFSAYSVPEAKVGLVKDVNRANQVGVEITFNSECVQPRLNLWDETLTNHLAKEFDEKLIIQHDNPVPRDEEFALKRDEFDVKNFVKTINEVRETNGQEPVAWGNHPWIPLNLAQPGGASTTPQDEPPDEPEPVDTPEEEPGDIELPEEEERAACGCVKVKRQFLRDENAKVAYWKQFDRRALVHERQFRTMVNGLFNDQEKEVLANLKEVVPKIEGQFNGWSKATIHKYFKKNPKLIKQIIFDEEDAGKKFVEGGEPLIANAFEESGQVMLTELGIDEAFDLENKRARKFIGDKAAEFAKEVNDTTAKQLRITLREGFAEGESIGKMASRVRKVYDTATKSRSRTIARTEIIPASNGGTLEGMRQSGVVDEKEWLSTRDDRVRDDHEDMDTVRESLNENFTLPDGSQTDVPGNTGVAAQDVNERCTLIPVIK
jgi:phage portal protein BeeE